MGKTTGRTPPTRPAGYPRVAQCSYAYYLAAMSGRKSRGRWRTNADKPRKVATLAGGLERMLEEQAGIVRSKRVHDMPLPGVWTPPSVRHMATQDFLRHDGEVEEGLAAAGMSHLI